MPVIHYPVLQEIAAKHGFSLSVVTADKIPSPGASGKMLNQWCGMGYNAEMKYLNRGLAKLDPRQLLSGLESILILRARYSGAAVERCPQGFGRVARYAWGLDYHAVLKDRTIAMLSELQACCGRRFESRICCDATSLLEKSLAEAGGGVFRGKNSLAIVSGIGSFFFLAEVLWNVEVVWPGHEGPELPGCGQCRRCLDVCPGQAICGDYLLDARRCISYLTVEKKGVLSVPEREWIGEWVFGCDLCQEVCPYNKLERPAGERSDFAEFDGGCGVGPFLDLGRVLRIRKQDEFSALFSKTSLMRAGRERLLRNAAVAAGNSRAVQLVGDLLAAAAEDPSALVRQHALWALFKLQSGCDTVEVSAVQKALVRACSDDAGDVAAEAKALLDRF